ncbi:MAG: helix-turn-helix domain-containing protein [Erysipelotrichaceae bacterium]
MIKSNVMKFSDFPDVVTVQEMCEMLGGINVKTGRKILQENQIQHFKIGRIYYIPKAHIMSYLRIK